MYPLFRSCLKDVHSLVLIVRFGFITYNAAFDNQPMANKQSLLWHALDIDWNIEIRMDDDLILLELTMSLRRVNSLLDWRDHKWVVKQNWVVRNGQVDNRNEELNISDFHRLERCLKESNLKKNE